MNETEDLSKLLSNTITNWVKNGADGRNHWSKDDLQDYIIRISDYAVKLAYNHWGYSDEEKCPDCGAIWEECDCHS